MGQSRLLDYQHEAEDDYTRSVNEKVFKKILSQSQIDIPNSQQSLQSNMNVIQKVRTDMSSMMGLSGSKPKMKQTVAGVGVKSSN